MGLHSLPSRRVPGAHVGMPSPFFTREATSRRRSAPQRSGGEVSFAEAAAQAFTSPSRLRVSLLEASFAPAAAPSTLTLAEPSWDRPAENSKAPTVRAVTTCVAFAQSPWS